MNTYYCSENGMRGIIIIEAASTSKAIIKYRNRTGRKPDLIHQEGHPIK